MADDEVDVPLGAVLADEPLELTGPRGEVPEERLDVSPVAQEPQRHLGQGRERRTHAT